jgi:putative glutathione S-transferase
MRRLYWEVPAFKDTCNFEHIKTHYYWSHPHVSGSGRQRLER